MKKTLLFIFLFQMISLAIYAHDFEVNGIYYKKLSDGNSVAVTYRYSTPMEINGEYSGLVNIPSKVSYEGVEYTVKEIAESSFEGCDGISTIIIPETVVNIGKYNFESSSLLNITINQNNSVYASKDGVLFNKSMTELLRYPCALGTEYTVPDGVKVLKKDSFSDAELKKITLSSSVETIEDDAFNDCEKLAELVLNEGLQVIEGDFLDGCSSMKNVNIPASLLSFTADVKGDNVENINVAQGNSVYESHDGLLYGKGMNVLIRCPRGKTGMLTLPYGVSVIGEHAFKKCKNIVEISFPSSLRSINSSAFSSCEGLKNVDIPHGVTTIGEAAFQGCKSIVKMSIPSTVVKIEDYALNLLSSLTDLYNYAESPQSLSTTFSQYGTLHVLPGCKSAYENADVWKNFTIIEDEVMTSVANVNVGTGDVIMRYSLDGRNVVNKDGRVNIVKFRNGKVMKILNK